MSQAQAGQSVFIEPGDHVFTARPDPVPPGVAVHGATRWSRLIRGYSASNYEAFINLSPGFHTRFGHCSLMAADGTTGGIALQAASTATDALYYSQIEDMTVSGHGSGVWSMAVNINGNAQAIGARMNYLRDILVGAAVKDYGFMFNHCKGLYCSGIHTSADFRQSTDPQAAGIFVTGLPDKISDNVNMTVNGSDLRFGYCAGAVVTAGALGRLVFETGASNCDVTAGVLLGLLSGAGVNNNVIR